MLPSARSVFLFAVVVVGFLVHDVLTPVVLDPSAEGGSQGTPGTVAAATASPSLLSLPAAPSREVSSNDLIAVEEVAPFVASARSRSILSLDENKHGRFFLALPNGTIYYMNRSTKPQWKLLIGQPLSYSWRAPSVDDPQYIMFSNSDGELYEYSKDSGIRKHKWTVEEYVQRAPVVKGSVITTGTKTSTIYVVDVDTGELIYSDNEPFSWTSVGVRTTEEQSVASKLESGNATYITIVRTDYFLDSYDVNNHLWSLMISRISACNVRPGLPPAMDDEIEMQSVSEGNIPVYFPGEADQLQRLKLMLPSTSYEPNTKMWSGLDDEQVSECEYNTNCSEEIVRSLKMESRGSRHILERPDNTFNSLGGSQGFHKAPNGCPLGNCVSARPDFPVVPTNFMNSRSGHRDPVSKYEKETSNTSNNLLDDTSNDSPDGSSNAQKGIWLLLQSIYQGFNWLFVSFYAILLMFCYVGFRKLFKYNKDSDDVKNRQSTLPKKRKSRKAGNLKNSALNGQHEKYISSSRDDAEINVYSQIQGNGSYPFINLTRPDDGGDGRWVGRLFVTNCEIGRGSNGTIVLEGIYDGRPVAVKRLLRAHHDVALKEIQNLIASDLHPNVVRWYGVEQDVDFVYISLERCICSLGDLIQLCSNSSSNSVSVESPTSNSIIEHKVQIGLAKSIGKEFNLWKANGLPSSQLLKLMRDVVSGLAHLHELGIIHRDLKPQNVLISNDNYLNAKLSDMGISKRLVEDMSALSCNATGYGSSGWQAPEQLLHGRQTRAIDLFSLGCILFFCITKGKHPFGNHFERDANIINNRMDLFLVDHIPEAEHLLSQMLHHNPQMRPNTVEVYHHPLFWSSETRLSFIRDASDRVELEDRENESDLLKSLENIASVAFSGKWDEKLDAAFITDMGRYRKYRFDCVRDLLRVIRNKLNHYRELPKDLQEILGPVPEGFDMYFTSRFPKLLIEVYKVVAPYCKEEDSLSKYFSSSLL